MRIAAFLSLSFAIVYAFDSAMSMQGFTGLINTPNAQVAPQGVATIHFDNQRDNHLRGFDYEREYRYHEDYIFGIGLLPYMEIQGRLAEARGYVRDLSANAKLQLPFHHPYLPDLAIGIQDAGGAANNYDNTYAVLDKELWFVRASVGYGKGDDSDKSRAVARMDGVFYGLEVEVAPWLQLLAEDDAQERHGALRLSLPPSWELPIGLNALLACNFDNDNELSFGINLTVPLLREQQRISTYEAVLAQPDTVAPSAYTPQPPAAPILRRDPPLDIRRALIDYGFENIRVGSTEETLHVHVENNLFDHNELDALGVVLGIIAHAPQKRFALTLRKSNLPILHLQGDLDGWRAFMRDPSTLSAFAATLSTQAPDESHVDLGERGNGSFFIPRLELSPGLTTAAGTEVGVFDYIVSLRANLYATIYDGLILSAMADLPLAHSRNFDEGRVFYRMYEERTESRLMSVMAHQTLHYDTLFATFSAGRYQADYNGAMAQGDYQLCGGSHALKARLGYFAHESDSEDARELYLGSYRYYYAPLDLFAEATYGRYWHQDEGVTLELKRDFDDVAVSLIYQNTDEQFAGARVSIPLTPRKLFASRVAQIKGKNDFYYGLRSTINREDGTNTLNPSSALIPLSDIELSSYYRNRDRIGSAYIKAHLHRLRNAAALYLPNEAQ
ncbi:MAG: YjbH domain-containing protein [Campylobacterales bacterium]|nr:YjbH domain-containing protein [Campylobacterales bacterium]